MTEYTERMSMLQGLIFSGAMILLAMFLCVAAYLTCNALRPLRHLERVLDQGEIVEESIRRMNTPAT